MRHVLRLFGLRCQWVDVETRFGIGWVVRCPRFGRPWCARHAARWARFIDDTAGYQ